MGVPSSIDAGADARFMSGECTFIRDPLKAASFCLADSRSMLGTSLTTDSLRGLTSTGSGGREAESRGDSCGLPLIDSLGVSLVPVDCRGASFSDSRGASFTETLATSGVASLTDALGASLTDSLGDSLAVADGRGASFIETLGASFMDTLGTSAGASLTDACGASLTDSLGVSFAVADGRGASFTDALGASTGVFSFTDTRGASLTDSLAAADGLGPSLTEARGEVSPGGVSAVVGDVACCCEGRGAADALARFSESTFGSPSGEVGVVDSATTGGGTGASAGSVASSIMMILLWFSYFYDGSFCQFKLLWEIDFWVSF